MIELGHFAVGTTWPALTLIIDLPVEEGFRRTGRKPSHAGRNRKRRDSSQGLLLSDVEPDAMEARPIEYHRKVRQNFLSLPSNYPGVVEVVDGGGSTSQVHQRIVEVLGRVSF